MTKRTTTRDRRIPAGSWAASVACIAGLGLACGPGTPPADPGPVEPRAFALEHVTLGVAFDETVVVEGGVGSADPHQTTGVPLAPDADAARYTGSLRASDLSGNATDVQLEVTLGDPQDEG